MRRKTTFATIAILALVTSACASGKDTGFPPIPKTTAGSSAAGPTCADANDTPVALNGTIDLPSGNCFVPKVVTVKVGTKVEWKDVDANAPHTVTAADGSFDSSPDCPADTSKCLTSGGTYDFTFTKAGTFAYYCKLHGTAAGQGMAGKITVQG